MTDQPSMNFLRWPQEIRADELFKKFFKRNLFTTTKQYLESNEKSPGQQTQLAKRTREKVDLEVLSYMPPSVASAL